MLSVNNISAGYTVDNPILKDISFSLENGEVICIMGESGSGKSTLLKTIYGLLDLNKGNIFWNDTKITGPKENLIPGFEAFKYVPQNFELMPYTSVSENISKHLSRFNLEESKQRVDHLLEVMEMTSYANTKTKDLSGGQKQRVAIARALAIEPSLLLLDEPFGQIDNFKRNGLRRNLFTSLKEKKIPCIIATHDAQDALSFADKIIVLKDGMLIENKSPKKLYKYPKEKYIASLLDDVNELTINNEKILLYPSQIKIVEESKLSAKVINSYFKGFYWLIECNFGAKSLFINHHKKIEKNTEINFSIEFNF